jgi:excisionase family DNA binding protein
LDQVGDPDSDEPLLSSGDVAKRLGVSRRTISEWVRRGRLAPTWTTLGGRHRFRWSEVEAQIKAAQESDDW